MSTTPFHSKYGLFCILLLGSMAQGQAICCDCLNVTTTPGCAADLVCEGIVCAQDAFCCTNGWDYICVAGYATKECAGTTCCDCKDETQTPGCAADLVCEDTICAIDSFCCTDEWDSICVNKATFVCASTSESPSLQPSISPSLHPSISPTLVPTGSPFATTDDSNDSDDDDSQSGESSTEAQNSMNYAHQSDGNHIERNLRHTAKVEIDFSSSELCIITGVCTFLTVAFWICQYCVNGK